LIFEEDVYPMLTQVLIAAQAADTAAAAAPAKSAYGIIPMFTDDIDKGNWLPIIVALILVTMLFFTLYILVTKLLEQNKVMAQGKAVGAKFWSAPSLKDGAGSLEKDSAYRQIVDDGLIAQDQHGKLTDPVDQHDWILSALARSQAAINSQLGTGLAFLATVGSTAPFIGLFGTVVGILSALVKIGAAGQASIDAVAGPVGEALYMTAFGLLVAVPAVLAFNWLQRRNKAISEDMAAFSTSIYGYMGSAGALRPSFRAAAPAKPAAAPTAAKA
jgi:biopolymer transport protein ExbB